MKQSKEITWDMKIIFQTAYTDEFDREQTAKAGADAFLGKPYSYDNIV